MQSFSRTSQGNGVQYAPAKCYSWQVIGRNM